MIARQSVRVNTAHPRASRGRTILPAAGILLCILLVLAALPAAASAQAILRGSVADSVSGERLIGVNVYLVGTAYGGVTDRQGEFRVVGVPGGAYQLRVSYVGYRAKELEVTLSENESTTLDIRLVVDVIESGEVVVTAQLRGQVAAINQQLTANTIMNVISEEKIQELPDANAAEAIGRLPGVSILRSGGEANKVILRGLSDRFTAITVDGIRIPPTDADARGVDLSTIAQGSLAGVELYKALTPDMDGDAIAGSVNLATKKAPATRLLRFDVRGGYNQLDDSYAQYDFAARYGERFFDDVLGIQLTGNLEQRRRSNEQLELEYYTALANYTDYRIENFTPSYTNEVRKRGGAGLLLDVNTPDEGSIKLHTIYNATTRDYVYYSRDYPAFAGDFVRYGFRDRERKIATFNGSLIGENYLMGLTTTWGLSYAQSVAEYPFDYEMQFVEAIDSAVGSGMRSVPASIGKGPPELFIPYAYNNFSRAWSEWAYYRGEENEDRERTGYLNLAKKWFWGDRLGGEFKLGGKYRSKSRFKEMSELSSPYYLGYFWPYTHLADGTVVPKNLQGTRFADLPFRTNVLLVNFLDAPPAERSVYDQYSLYPLANRDALRQWYELNKGGIQNLNGTGLPEYARNTEVDGDYYDITERVASGYLMGTFTYGQDLTFIAGVRVEQENSDYASRYTPEPVTGFPMTGRLIDTTVSYTQTEWLPNFQLVVRPVDFMTIRAALYQAVARPAFNQRLERLVARSGGGDVALYVGNPNLQSAKATNYELNTSFYSNTIGLISISGFYKEIKDMFHTMEDFRTSGQTVLDSLGSPWGRVDPSDFPFQPNIIYDLTYPVNTSGLTKVWGFEVEHQANLTFLPGLLRNIVLSYNFSIIRSETYVIRARVDTMLVPSGLPPPFPPFLQQTYNTAVEVKDKLESQPEFFGNVALGYDYKGFSIRLSVFHQGEYNRSFSASGRSDEVVDSFTRWDLSVRQRFTDYLSAFFFLNNFTNVEETTTIKNIPNNWILLNTSQKYGPSYELGLRLEI